MRINRAHAMVHKEVIPEPRNLLRLLHVFDCAQLIVKDRFYAKPFVTVSELHDPHTPVWGCHMKTSTFLIALLAFALIPTTTGFSCRSSSAPTTSFFAS